MAVTVVLTLTLSDETAQSANVKIGKAAGSPDGSAGLRRIANYFGGEAAGLRKLQCDYNIGGGAFTGTYKVGQT